MMIFAGSCTALAILFLPETYAPVLLLKKTQLLRASDPEKYKEFYAEHEKQDFTPKGLLHRTVYRPVNMMAKEPILVLITIYMSFVYGIIYARECHRISICDYASHCSFFA